MVQSSRSRCFQMNFQDLQDSNIAFGASASGTNLATWRKTSASASARCCCSRLAAAVKKPWRCSQRPRNANRTNEWIRSDLKNASNHTRISVFWYGINQAVSLVSNPRKSTSNKMKQTSIQQLWPTIELYWISWTIQTQESSPSETCIIVSFHRSCRESFLRASHSFELGSQLFLGNSALAQRQLAASNYEFFTLTTSTKIINDCPLKTNRATLKDLLIVNKKTGTSFWMSPSSTDPPKSPSPGNLWYL